MPGIDRFLSKPLELVIKKSVNQKNEYKIKRLLFEKYGISIRQSIEYVEKLFQIRKEVLGETDYNLLKKITQKIISIEKSVDGKSYTLKILDESFKESIMKNLGDIESREILQIMMDKSHSNSEILTLLHLSTTSGYRKINNLIHDGFLIKSKSKIVESRRSVDLYTAFCNKMSFELQRNKLILVINVNKKNIESSSIFKLLYSI